MDRAAAQKVYIKVRQIHGRGMIYRYVNPFLEGEISERTLSEYPDWSASDKDHQRELNSGRRLIRVAQRHDMPLSTELASSFKGIILPNPAYSQQVVDPILANPELIDRKTSAVMDKIRARKGGNKENSKTLDISLNL